MDKIKDTTTKQLLEDNILQYLADNKKKIQIAKNPELEVRFGTNPQLKKPITMVDYDNILQKLLSIGFKPEFPEGVHILRIYSEKPKTKGVFANIRTEINGLYWIQQYCKTNSIDKILNHSAFQKESNTVKFTQKITPIDATGNSLRDAVFPNHNFKVSYKLEKDYSISSDDPEIQDIMVHWTETKKIFRFINRIHLIHPDYDFAIDMSIVKMGSTSGEKRTQVPFHTIQEAQVFKNLPTYEVEFELINDNFLTIEMQEGLKKIQKCIQQGVRIVLGAIQKTNYPIGYDVIDDILTKYMKLVNGNQYQPRRLTNKDFVGPQPITLELENLNTIENTRDTNIVSIRENYCVTEKADGERHLLYIATDGSLYLIDTNLNVVNTGYFTKNKNAFNSLFDGEFIRKDKMKNSLQLFACFDLYFYGGKDVRALPFIFTVPLEDNNNINTDVEKYRLSLLQSIITKLELTTNISIDHKCMFSVECKSFEISTPQISIFQCCEKILSFIKNGLCRYETDGLIFTPCSFGVGLNGKGMGQIANNKITWNSAFKWKPAEFNSVDFLVSFKKDKNGKDEIHEFVEEGVSTNLVSLSSLRRYKTLILHCGFSIKQHGFPNGFDMVLDGNFAEETVDENDNTYKPYPFMPTNPYDTSACLANVFLKTNGNNDEFVFTEEGEFFEANTIVEFKYVPTNALHWRWIPMRIRHDKTADLLQNGRNFGNDYNVANSVWHSIHYPVKEEMLITGEGIPEFDVDISNVYYNAKNQKQFLTDALKEFHNRYVKFNLITRLSNYGDTLIDFCVGKAGDMSKWERSRLQFVYGIDISKDNITNPIDGACARYIQKCRKNKKDKNLFTAIFLQGNTSKNIRNGNAFGDDRYRKINFAIFGRGAKDRTQIGVVPYKHYGIGSNGFNISSCQFAMHYFFENINTLHSFLRNVCECTKLGGYYIATCYDGNQIFQWLQNKSAGQSMTVLKKDTKILEIVKEYNEDTFPDNEMSLGYKIKVFQESIDQYIEEYLVNFTLLIQLMRDYGFEIITAEEAKGFGFPSGCGSFKDLYLQMMQEIRNNPNLQKNVGMATQMSDEEKTISFLNKYCIFKKVNDVPHPENVQKIEKKEQEEINELLYGEKTKPAQYQSISQPQSTQTKSTSKQKKTSFRKSNSKISIQKYKPIEPELLG